MNTTNHLNTHEQQQPKRANKIKTLATAALLAVTGAVSAQNAATIDPKYYSMSNPYIVPNLADRSTMNIAIKAGEIVPITIDGMDPGSSSIIRDPNSNNIPFNDIIKINKPWTRTRQYKSNWITKATTINVNYQADIYDRTAWSNTLNKRPDVSRVNAGEQAKLSAGPNMKRYARKNIETWSIIGNTAIDSVKNVSRGTFITNTQDGSWNAATQWSKDTISVLEKPTITKNTAAFPSTGQGVTYRFLKYDPSGSIHVADSTWTEVTSFVGDGNAKSVTLPEKSKIRVGTKVAGTNHLEEFNLPTFTTDFGTDTPEIEWDVNTFRHHGRELNREVETPYIIYDMTGRELSVDKASQTMIPDHISGPVIIKYTNPGNNIQTKKIIVK